MAETLIATRLDRAPHSPVERRALLASARATIARARALLARLSRPTLVCLTPAQMARLTHDEIRHALHLDPIDPQTHTVARA